MSRGKYKILNTEYKMLVVVTIILAFFGFTKEVLATYYTSGNFISTNLFEGMSPAPASIDSFVYNLSVKPSPTTATVGFNQDGSSTWYNAAGVEGTETLVTGENQTITLTSGWSGPNFYYKVTFTSDGTGTPVLDDIKVNYTPSVFPTAPTLPYCEGSTNPNDVSDTTPEFSAIYNDPETGDIANKYRIQVNTQSDFAGTEMWDSGADGTAMADCTEGNRCQDIFYAGTALSLDGSGYFWRIKFWDDDGNEGAWSATQSFIMQSETNYDFVGVTSPSGGNSAYEKYGSESFTNQDDTGNGEATQDDYDNLESSNDVRWITDGASEDGHYDSQLYKFYIDESESSVTQLDFSWEGYGETHGEGYPTSFYAWNYNTNQWDLLQEVTFTTTTDQTLTGSKTTDAGNYIDTDGEVTLIVKTAKKGCDVPGVSCGVDGECCSGHCVDSVCCDTACDGTCEACTAAKKGSGSDGTCGYIADGTDPDGECATHYRCDGAGACTAPCSGVTSCIAGPASGCNVFCSEQGYCGCNQGYDRAKCAGGTVGCVASAASCYCYNWLY